MKYIKLLLSSIFLLVLLVVNLLIGANANAMVLGADAKVARWAPIVKREGQAYLGLNSPTAMFLGQIYQESKGDEKVTAWDFGRGLAQFMDPTTAQIVKQFPELGVGDPYNPQWAVRAMVRYNNWIFKKMKGENICEQWAPALKGYNAGPGYPMQAQAKSPNPGKWFLETEYITGKQTPQNFEYSRTYPRKILFNHQPRFAQFGGVICDVKNPPPDPHPLVVTKMTGKAK